MSIFGLSKISHRLTAIYAMIFFVALFGVSGATLFSVNLFLNNSSSQQLSMINQTIRGEITTLEQLKTVNLKNIAQMADNIDITIIHNGSVVYSTGEIYDLIVKSKSLNPMISKTVNGQRIMFWVDDLVFKDGDAIQIRIIKDLSNDEIYLNGLTIIMGTTDIIIFLISILVGYYVSRKALSPIDNITQQAKKISASDLSARLEINGPEDELKRLSDTFNEMIARIEASYDRQKSFTMDASHELATPLAVIKGYIDVMDRWGKDDRAVLEEGISSIKNELSNMTALMDTLLLISKNDNNQYIFDLTEFNLSELLDEIVKESRLVSNQHVFHLETEINLKINGDHRLIKQMLRAVIDNSIKYSPKRSRINIICKRMKEMILIDITDYGIGIPVEDLPYVFERFYRADKSRSRSIVGSGLGLSIVKWIAEIHKGSVKVYSIQGKGTTITIELPLAS